VRYPRVDVQVGDVVRGLVAVGVLADEAVDIRRCVGRKC
jgi:hypothetical protein